jgi:hypothetical protein
MNEVSDKSLIELIYQFRGRFSEKEEKDDELCYMPMKFNLFNLPLKDDFVVYQSKKISRTF